MLYWHHTKYPDTYLPPEDREGLATSLAYKTRTPWAGGRVCGVSRTGGKSEGSSTGPKPWLLASDGPCTHDFIQQTTTWSPHGRGPCLTVTKQLQFSIYYLHVHPNVTDDTKKYAYEWVRLHKHDLRKRLPQKQALLYVQRQHMAAYYRWDD